MIIVCVVVVLLGCGHRDLERALSEKTESLVVGDVEEGLTVKDVSERNTQFADEEDEILSTEDMDLSWKTEDSFTLSSASYDLRELIDGFDVKEIEVGAIESETFAEEHSSEEVELTISETPTTIYLEIDDVMSLEIDEGDGNDFSSRKEAEVDKPPELVREVETIAEKSIVPETRASPEDE
jgi:hypothetical protein